MRCSPWAVILTAMCVLCASMAFAQGNQGGQNYRLYEGITAYVNNPDGKDFSVHLEIRDLNMYAQGPREVLFKVYDPDGQPVVREIIPDDGVTQGAFPDRIGGWDHELQYYMNLYAKGTKPSFRWSAWSDPNRLKTIVPQTFDRPIKGGKKGTYRIMLAGTIDHVATLKLTPDLKYGVCGHTTWIHGHHDLFKKRYIYIPKGTVGIFLALTEPDQPATRSFTLTAPDGKVLFEGKAAGGYKSAGGYYSWQSAPITFANPAEYEGKLLTLDVSDGTGDYLLKVTLQQYKSKGSVFDDYVGMGSPAIYCETPELAMALKGGTIVEDGEVFWHPFQVRFHRWLMAHPLAEDANDQQKALRKDLEALFKAFRLLETSDGRGSASWTNWGYAFGYYGCRIWRTSWLLMPRADVPDDLKAIIREGLIMGGDRLSFAAGMEAVNGNAFSQINVALWYCHRATGDKMQKERFEVFWDRWRNGGWGPGAGISKSGDSQEHFSHDMHYGSYIMDNWKAKDNQWVKEGGILGDAVDDPRFQEVIDRYQELYSYLYCREKWIKPGTEKVVAANPWSSRTSMHPHKESTNWEMGTHTWKGDPGPDLTVSVNGGDEWFAARRKGYYFLTFHGKLAPEWMSQCFEGQLGFGGGTICQLTVPGKGPVLASTLTGIYGKGMHPSNWRNFHIHSLVGESWDGSPLVASISEHDNARLDGNTVTSSGEVRNSHVKVARSFTYHPDSIDCAVQLEQSDYANALSIWSHERYWSEVKVAYEMFPFMPKDPTGKKSTAVTLLDATSALIGPATTTPTEAQAVRIDRDGFGVEIKLEKPMKVLLGGNNTVMVQIVEQGEKPTPAEQVTLKYKLVPFGN